VSEHAAFMNALTEEGFVLFGGPLAGTEDGRVRALLIANADSGSIARQSLPQPDRCRLAKKKSLMQGFSMILTGHLSNPPDP
jgi:hypothetical protein